MLDVYLYDEYVGCLRQETTGLAFAYGGRALDEPNRFALSVRLPVRAEPYPHHITAPFFDNLLPEGSARDALAAAAKYDPSDVQGLLGAVGGECAGAVSLRPVGSRPSDVPDYVPCSAAQLERLFSDTETTDFTAEHVTGRQSMSGVQDKLVLLRRGTSYALPRGGAPTNVLLKRERQRYPGLVHNELACLRLMAGAAVPVALATAPLGFSGLLESTRYDRVDTGGVLTRLHQEDLCQATGKLPRQKYQEHNGPALADIAAVLIRHSVDPLADLNTLAHWTVANLCLGNNDAHAKNLSLLYTPQGIRLAPAYDVVCTAAYPNLDQRLSLAFGGAYTVEGITAAHVRKCARALRMGPNRLSQVVEEVTMSLADSVDQVCHDVGVAYGYIPVLDTIRDIVKERCIRIRERVVV